MSTIYTARFQIPDRIERGTDWLVQCPVWYAGALVAPVSGTCTVYNASNEVAATGPISITASVAEFTVTGASTTGQTLGERWRVEWALTLTGGPVRVFRNTAALVLRGLYPVITDQDLYRRSSALDPANVDRVITDQSDYQAYIDEAWVWLDGMLVRKGRRPQLIMSSTDLRETHITKTLGLIFRDLSQRNVDTYADWATRYETQALEAFNACAFVYDDDEDGHADNEKRKPAVGSIWTNGRAPGNTWGWGR